MSMSSKSLRDRAIISDTEISDRIDYLAFLDDDELSDSDRDLWEDEIEELAALRALTAAIGTGYGTLISEDYWKEYAASDADELFNLQATGADVYFAYGGYDKYADDLQTDYSQVQFLDTTYYYQGG